MTPEEHAKTLVNIIDSGRNNGWSTIDTAPKDGTEILGWHEFMGVVIIRWTSPSAFLGESDLEQMGEESAFAQDWFCADFIHGDRLEGKEVPTHWMALPEPPKEGI
jgi:hypothetical protein